MMVTLSPDDSLAVKMKCHMGEQLFITRADGLLDKVYKSLSLRCRNLHCAQSVIDVVYLDTKKIAQLA